jgi:hypothetical protein
MSNFKWIIPQNSMITAKSLDGLSDVVIRINAIRQIYTDTNSTQIEVGLGLTSPTDVFIPYQDLTQEIIESWLNEGLPVNEIDQTLYDQLNNIVNPSTIILPNPF